MCFTISTGTSLQFELEHSPPQPPRETLAGYRPALVEQSCESRHSHKAPPPITAASFGAELAAWPCLPPFSPLLPPASVYTNKYLRVLWARRSSASAPAAGFQLMQITEAHLPLAHPLPPLPCSLGLNFIVREVGAPWGTVCVGYVGLHYAVHMCVPLRVFLWASNGCDGLQRQPMCMCVWRADMCGSRWAASIMMEAAGRPATWAAFSPSPGLCITQGDEAVLQALPLAHTGLVSGGRV